MMITLRKRSEVIQLNLEKFYETFKEELNKLMPIFNNKLFNIQSQLQNSNVNSKEANVEQVCKFLDTIEAKVTDLDDLVKSI